MSENLSNKRAHICTYHVEATMLTFLQYFTFL